MPCYPGRLCLGLSLPRSPLSDSRPDVMQVLTVDEGWRITMTPQPPFFDVGGRSLPPADVSRVPSAHTMSFVGIGVSHVSLLARCVLCAPCVVSFCGPRLPLVHIKGSRHQYTTDLDPALPLLQP